VKEELLNMLNSVANGSISPEEAWKSLEGFFFEDIGFARVDHRRAHRFGFPEPVFAPGKTIEELTEIAERLVQRSGRAFLTRLSSEQTSAVEAHFAGQSLRLNRRARTCLLGEVQAEQTERALVVSAGTSDAPVAEEAWETLLASGFEVPKVLDAGVAGIHRLLAEKERIEAAEVVVVVAGMEGALASVVGGLASSLVIGVPTSVGYGASFGGVSALLAMLNSCSPNVVTVNIDDGFGAGFTAGLVLRRASG
jgi:NCAIR mutase (PurE)-related protein